MALIAAPILRPLYNFTIELFRQRVVESLDDGDLTTQRLLEHLSTEFEAVNRTLNRLCDQNLNSAQDDVKWGFKELDDKKTKEADIYFRKAFDKAGQAFHTVSSFKSKVLAKKIQLLSQLYMHCFFDESIFLVTKDITSLFTALDMLLADLQQTNEIKSFEKMSKETGFFNQAKLVAVGNPTAAAENNALVRIYTSYTCIIKSEVLLRRSVRRGMLLNDTYFSGYVDLLVAKEALKLFETPSTGLKNMPVLSEFIKADKVGSSDMFTIVKKGGGDKESDYEFQLNRRCFENDSVYLSDCVEQRKALVNNELKPIVSQTPMDTHTQSQKVPTSSVQQQQQQHNYAIFALLTVVIGLLVAILCK